MRRKIAQAILAIYVLGAVGMMANFLSMPPTEVGNPAMIIWTLPMSIAGLIFVFWPFEIPFPFMPAFLGYYGGHIAFFVPSAMLMSYLIWRIIGRKSS